MTSQPSRLKLLLFALVLVAFAGQAFRTSAQPTLSDARSPIAATADEQQSVAPASSDAPAPQNTAEIVVEASVAAAYFVAASYAMVTDQVTQYANYYGSWWSAQTSCAAQDPRRRPSGATLNPKTEKVFDQVNETER